MARILLIEDDEDQRFSVARLLRKRGHEVVEAVDVAGAHRALAQTRFDLMATDMNLPDGDGIDLVTEARSAGHSGGILVITAYASIETAVAAMRAGADDFLQKPIQLKEFALVAQRLLEDHERNRRLSLIEREKAAAPASDRPLGLSERWQTLLGVADRYAQLPLVNRHEEFATQQGGALPTILLSGETGSGKGVVARYIHDRAGDAGRDEPFVHVNCSSLPPDLVESELFGHEKGAFTDARKAKAGLAELADGGTFFLDEIGDLRPDLQAKLLVFLESGRFRRVGAAAERSVRCRVIAASNRALNDPQAPPPFRQDLYYRLSTFTLRIPALRERDGDAVIIAEQMLERFRREYRLPPCTLSAGAKRAIQAHGWPGNVRELVNVMQRIAMLTQGDRIEADGLLTCLRNDRPQTPGFDEASGVPVFDFHFGVHKAWEVERELIAQALAHTQGNVAQAARLLDLQRSSLRHRIAKYGLGQTAAGETP